MEKLNIKKLVAKLSALGEDKAELNLWLSIFEDLQPDEQQELLFNLQDEIKKLEQIK